MAVQEFKTPQNVKEVRQFIGLTSFFRKFIKDFARIVAPLTTLTKKDEEFTWGKTQAEAFHSIKSKLTQKPILTIYDPKAEHEVHTDASKEGLGGVLLQKTENEHYKAVYYYSRKTTDAEKKYHSYELEALAVVEAIDRFRIYVLGKRFKVITDCNSLKTTMNKKDINPRIGRWWLKIQDFDFELIHRPSDKTQHVDALSRNPVEPAREIEVADLKILGIQITEEDWLTTMQYKTGS